MRIAVIGASGFVGKNLVKYALEQGHEVLGIDGDSKKNKYSLILDEPYFRGARRVIANLYDSDSMAALLGGCDAVYDFIGISAESGNDTFESVNIGITKAVIEACKKAKPRRFLYNSGLGTAHYGDERFPWVQNRYFASLVEAEKAIVKSGLAYTIFRPSYIIGRDNIFTQRMKERIQRGEVLLIGEGKARLQPIFVGDAAKACLAAAADKSAENRFFDMVGPEKISFVAYARLMAEVMRSRGLIAELPKFRNVSVEDAKAMVDRGELKMSKEQVEIRVCDETGDHRPLEKLGVRLMHPDRFLEAILD